MKSKASLSRTKKEEIGHYKFVKFEDLQIGHYLMDPVRGNTVVKIVALDENGRAKFYGPTGVRHSVMAHNLYAIPLSFDMMVLFGFQEIKINEREVRNLSFKFEMNLEHYCIEVIMAGKIAKAFKGEGNVRSNQYRVFVNGYEVVGCDKVHKLQTLYNGLTGEKLIFKHEKRQ